MSKKFSMNNIFKYLLVFAFSIQLGCKKKPEDITRESKQFTLLSPKSTKVYFNNKISETLEEYIRTFNYIYNGAGVAIADFDNDGYVDIIVTSPAGLTLLRGQATGWPRLPKSIVS